MNVQTEIVTSVELLKSLAPTGFAMALHVRFTTPTFLFQTYPKSWIDIYSQRGYLMSDPTVLWAFSNTGRIRWSELSANDASGMLAEAAAQGMRFGFTLATDAEGSQSLGSFTRGDREFSDDEIAEIEVIFLGLHAATRDLREFAPQTHAALKQMSVTYTHP